MKNKVKHKTLFLVYVVPSLRKGLGVFPISLKPAWFTERDTVSKLNQTNNNNKHYLSPTGIYFKTVVELET